MLSHRSKPKSAHAITLTAGSRAAEIMERLLLLREALTSQAGDEYAFLDYCRRNLHLSKSQIFQDLFVLFQTGEKRGGYFVEFGAGDGLFLSNTHLLEKQFGWSGILAEPARAWHPRLQQTRGCSIDHRCVWDRSGERLEFNETAEPEYSTVVQYSASDRHSAKREKGHRYLVETVSLIDLLQRNKAPRLIDYLSIDTEGSELEILKAFDFDRYDVRLISVEHNYTGIRLDICRLLQSQGFTRKFETVSQWDDWYVNANEAALIDGR